MMGLLVSVIMMVVKGALTGACSISSQANSSGGVCAGGMVDALQIAQLPASGVPGMDCDMPM
jgi:hypothetical protein